MTLPMDPRRFVLSTNIPTPYRLAFFSVLADEMASRRIELEVIFYARSEPNRHWRMDLAAQPYRWTVLPGLHPNLRSLYPHVNPTLPLAVRRARPTWLLVAGAWNTPSSLMALSRTLSGPGVRLFWSEGHAQAVLHAAGPIAAARRRVLRHYDGFVVPNEASERFVSQEVPGPLRFLRLPNTVDEAYYLAGPGAPRPAVRASLGIEPADRVLLCVAQLTERKGVLELAEAVRLLPDAQRRHAVLVFAGDGELAGRLAGIADGVRTRLLGHVDREVVRRWLHAADLFVLPSRVDPNPLSAIEAAFSGTPLVLSSRAGNVDDLVGPHCERGWRIASPDCTAIAEALTAALGVPEEERRRAGARAREVAVGQFSRRGAARRFLDDLLATFPGQ
jgi:glycosyltransferase involved in cell wall biosynthesis